MTLPTYKELDKLNSKKEIDQEIFLLQKLKLSLPRNASRVLKFPKFSSGI